VEASYRIDLLVEDLIIVIEDVGSLYLIGGSRLSFDLERAASGASGSRATWRGSARPS